MSTQFNCQKHFYFKLGGVLAALWLKRWTAES